MCVNRVVDGTAIDGIRYRHSFKLGGTEYTRIYTSEERIYFISESVILKTPSINFYRN